RSPTKALRSIFHCRRESSERHRRVSAGSRRHSVAVAGIERRFANILQAQNLRRQTFQANRQAAVRRHTELEHPEMAFKGVGRDAFGYQRPFEIFATV